MNIIEEKMRKRINRIDYTKISYQSKKIEKVSHYLSVFILSTFLCFYLEYNKIESIISFVILVLFSLIIAMMIGLMSTVFFLIFKDEKTKKKHKKAKILKNDLLRKSYKNPYDIITQYFLVEFYDKKKLEKSIEKKVTENLKELYYDNIDEFINVKNTVEALTFELEGFTFKSKDLKKKKEKLNKIIENIIIREDALIKKQKINQNVLKEIVF